MASPTWLFCQLGQRVVPRDRLGRTVRLPIRTNYNALVDEVNQEIRRLVDFFPRIRFWKHRGMRLNWCTLLHDDGVHLGAAGENCTIAQFFGQFICS